MSEKVKSEQPESVSLFLPENVRAVITFGKQWGKDESTERLQETIERMVRALEDALKTATLPPPPLVPPPALPHFVSKFAPAIHHYDSRCDNCDLDDDGLIWCARKTCDGSFCTRCATEHICPAEPVVAPRPPQAPLIEKLFGHWPTAEFTPDDPFCKERGICACGKARADGVTKYAVIWQRHMAEVLGVEPHEMEAEPSPLVVGPPQQSVSDSLIDILNEQVAEMEAESEAEAVHPAPPLKDLRDWLRSKSEEMFAQVNARRESGAKSLVGATEADLKAGRKLAEKMLGRKLDIDTSLAAAQVSAEMQDRIADKLEKEARQLSDWSDLLAAQQPTLSPQELNTIFQGTQLGGLGEALCDIPGLAVVRKKGE